MANMKRIADALNELAAIKQAMVNSASAGGNHLTARVLQSQVDILRMDARLFVPIRHPEHDRITTFVAREG